MSKHHELAIMNIDDEKIQTEHQHIRLNNRYLLGKQLGRGGLCIVYEAKDDYSEYFGDERPLAIKLPLEFLSVKSDIDAFMYAEYAHLSRLAHPNIVKVVDFGIDTDLNLPYLVMEQLKGGVVSDIPIREWTQSMKDVFFSTLLDTMHYLHAHHVIHADINPTNIMMLEDGSIRIFDFGISINTCKEQPFELDYTSIKAFNPRYAAPEIIQGHKPSYKSDLFSMAAVCYELYCGKLPYKEQSTELYEAPISFKDMRGLPFGLRHWFRNALSVKEEKRRDQKPFILNLKKYI